MHVGLEEPRPSPLVAWLWPSEERDTLWRSLINKTASLPLKEGMVSRGADRGDVLRCVREGRRKGCDVQGE